MAVLRVDHPDIEEFSGGHEVRCWLADQIISQPLDQQEAEEASGSESGKAGREPILKAGHLRIYYEQKSLSVLSLIGLSKKAFIKAVRRKSDRCNLPYFFGILKNIQKQHDDEAYRKYCHDQYNYQLMLKNQRQQKQKYDQDPIALIIKMLEKVVDDKNRFFEELALRKAREWTQELMDSYTYIGALKKKISDTLGGINHLDLEQKRNIWELIEGFLKPKSMEDGVTLTS